MEEDLKYKCDDPGVVQHGNFINYYKFHSAQDRINLLPKSIWNVNTNEEIVALDIGCNAGDLTLELHSYLKQTSKKCAILGVDIDPILIERANEKLTPNVTFLHLNFMNDDNRNDILRSYLKRYNKSKFDVIFCFSTTMWIHLNHGDDGLRKFLETLHDLSNNLIVEPQTWKSYRSTFKRAKKHKFPWHYLKIKDINGEIKQYFAGKGSTLIWESPKGAWDRKVLCFKNN